MQKFLTSLKEPAEKRKLFLLGGVIVILSGLNSTITVILTAAFIAWLIYCPKQDRPKWIAGGVVILFIAYGVHLPSPKKKDEVIIDTERLKENLERAAAGLPSLSSGYVGCTSKDSLDSFTNAQINNDERLTTRLLASFCMPIRDRFSVLDKGIVKSKIRLDDGTVLWVPTEATR